jgi:uncharacterized protein (DUF305 family)
MIKQASPAILSILLLICAATVPALEGSHHAHGDGSAVNSDWSELGSDMNKMHQAMAAVEASGDSDADFVRLMLPHHQAAIDMARTQLMYGRDPQIRRLAQEIITDQQSEIDVMQLWLKRRGSNSSENKEH